MELYLEPEQKETLFYENCMFCLNDIMFGPDTNKEEDETAHCDFGKTVGDLYTDLNPPVRAYILKFQQ